MMESETVSTVTPTLKMERKISSKAMFTIGIVLILVGATLSIVQLSWKEEHKVEVVSGLNRDFSLRTRPVGTGSHYNRLDESYLHVGIALMVIGTLFIVGGYLAKSFWQTGTSMPEQIKRQESVDNTASIPEQIEQLAKLKEQGILSESEFEEKKRELLARM
jgi:uncharacterized membrane protein